ncbi:DUF2147 domain-containing protein [Pontibacter silvestris]|uniref:DUF2147 domain-containing protein n=1 Tax=Pontibacter silvestris TaxID=2305183 RepID=A0ABW4X0J9_9BACT|nr:DUF2147 domain-containing protein [Pontibacter silvestris]MCC9136003.1 DUF2147 domain-containing protein [Pontibacter silvestris]
MKKPLLLFFTLLLITASTWAQSLSPIGTWTNQDGKGKFEIYKCGDKLCGRIASIKEPNLNGKPKTDVNNPEAKLRSRPLVGLEFMKGFEYVDNNKWDDGTIYDPESGKTYSCYMKMINKNKMEVKGYLGISLIGRTQTWTRVE